MIQKKICILGAFAVGKTSLVSRYVSSIFSEKYLTTVGVKIDKKLVARPGGDVSLVIWDLAGEDDIVRVRRSYFRGASGYLLVVDGTRPNTVETAALLRDRIQGQVGPIPCVALANKADLTEEWRVTDDELADLMPGRRAPLRTSAKTGEGVEEAFRQLVELMCDRPQAT
ncbi:MAG: Rab family GTPase [Planctomycetota bacterium]